MTVPAALPRLSFGSWAFSFGPFSSRPWAFDEVCRYVADAGYDGIEINGFRPHPHDEDHRDHESISRLRRLLDETGLDVSGFAPDFAATPPAEVTQDDYLARVDSTLAFCRSLGIGILRVDTGSPPGPFDRERFTRLVGTWREAARRCADAGVVLVWEFEPGFWLNRPSEVVRLVETVDHPAFALLFDTSHAYTGGVMGARQGAEPEILPGGVVEYARLVAEHIGHLHLIDSDGTLHNEETSEHLPFGRGDVPFDDVVAALGERATSLPWWTVDFCFCPTTETDGRLAVPIARELIGAPQASP